MFILNIRGNQILKLVLGTITQFVRQNHKSRYKSCRSNATKLFTISEVVPDIIPVAPPKFLEAFYPSGAVANAGNFLTPAQVDATPTVCFEGLFTSYYVLYFSDPDAPNRERHTYREFLHWLIVNIPGNNVGKGEVLSDYLTPCPGKLLGKHRYVFLIFEQPYLLEFDEPHISKNQTGGREMFKIKQFMEKYNLGNPIAGNLFFSEWDPHVECINKRIAKMNKYM